MFLLLVIALGAGSIAIAFNASGHLFDEVEQILNREYAASIATELQPLVADGFSSDMIKEEIHYMMVLNPMVEIYLISASGEVVSYFIHPDRSLERDSIDLVPIRRFVDGAGEDLILGDDPRGGSERKPFSAARLPMGDEEGFVYVILRGNSYDRSLQTIRNSYYLRTGLLTFLIAIAATLVAGLTIFFFLTRRLRALSSAVNAFELGELNRRVRVVGDDEIGDLGCAFNTMARSVESGVERLHVAERQRSDLIANISHDLRSPLTSIRGSLETVLLKDSQLETDERRELLDVSLKHISAFQELVEDLFELVRLENNQSTPDVERFQVDELLNDIVLKLKSRADQADVAIRLNPPEESPTIDADIGLVERAVTNLIENAVRFSAPGDAVEVRIEHAAEQTAIVVADSGPGIAKEDLPHIFERFFRADRSRDRTIPGTGLGLAIAKEIVELHGGSISAESEIGAGTTMRIVFRNELNPVASEN